MARRMTDINKETDIGKIHSKLIYVGLAQAHPKKLLMWWDHSTLLMLLESRGIWCSCSSDRESRGSIPQGRESFRLKLNTAQEKNMTFTYTRQWSFSQTYALERQRVSSHRSKELFFWAQSNRGFLIMSTPVIDSTIFVSAILSACLPTNTISILYP